MIYSNEDMKILYHDLVRIHKRGYKDAQLLPLYRIKKYEGWEKQCLGITDVENSKLFAERLNIFNQKFHLTFYKRTSIRKILDLENF